MSPHHLGVAVPHRLLFWPHAAVDHPVLRWLVLISECGSPLTGRCSVHFSALVRKVMPALTCSDASAFDPQSDPLGEIKDSYSNMTPLKRRCCHAILTRPYSSYDRSPEWTEKEENNKPSAAMNRETS
ncbi:hypothetical protein SRHO_G00268260 [Serrasalmus rhombeus]